MQIYNIPERFFLLLVAKQSVCRKEGRRAGITWITTGHTNGDSLRFSRSNIYGIFYCTRAALWLMDVQWHPGHRYEVMV